MSKDKPELYAIGEKVRVEDSGNYKDGTVIVVYNETSGLHGQSACSTRDPSRVSKLPPWEPKHGEQVYVKIEQSNITRVGTYIAQGPHKGSVLINFEWCYNHIIRPITDDYASVGKPWKDEE